MCALGNGDLRGGEGTFASAKLEKGVALELALCRSSVYRRLSDAFLRPDEELSEDFKGGQFASGLHGSLLELRELLSKSECADDGPSPSPLDEALGIAVRFKGESLAEMTIERLKQLYDKTFANRVDLPLTETSYCASQVFQQTQELSDIAGFYRAFGLKVAEEAHEQLDHIGIELEFMYFLCIKEAHAIEQRKLKEASLCHDAQMKFINDHLGKWHIALASLIEKEAQCKFFRDAASVLKNFVNFEIELLRASPEQLRWPSQNSLSSKPEKEHFSCCAGDDPGEFQCQDQT